MVVMDVLDKVVVAMMFVVVGVVDIVVMFVMEVMDVSDKVVVAMMVVVVG